MGKPKEPKPFKLDDVKKEVAAKQEKTKLNEKQNQKETNTMNKKHTIITIALTLAALAALGASFFYGMQFGISQEKAINGRVVSEAKSLVTITEAKK